MDLIVYQNNSSLSIVCIGEKRITFLEKTLGGEHILGDSKHLMISPKGKYSKKRHNNICFMLVGTANLPRFQGARADHVRVKSVFCSARGLLSLIHDT